MNDDYVLLPIEFQNFVDLWQRIDASCHKYKNCNDEDHLSLLTELNAMFYAQYQREARSGQIYDSKEDGYSPCDE